MISVVIEDTSMDLAVTVTAGGRRACAVADGVSDG